MGNLNTQELDAVLTVLRKHGVAAFKHGDMSVTLDPVGPITQGTPEKPLEGTAAKEAAEKAEREVMYRSSEG